MNTEHEDAIVSVSTDLTHVELIAGEKYDEYKIGDVNNTNIIIFHLHNSKFIDIYKLFKSELVNDKECSLMINKSVSKHMCSINMSEARDIAEYVKFNNFIYEMVSEAAPTILTIITKIATDENERQLKNKSTCVRKTSYIDKEQLKDYQHEIDEYNWVKRLERFNRRPMFDSSVKRSIVKDIPESLDKIIDNLKDLSDISEEDKSADSKVLQELVKLLGRIGSIRTTEDGRSVFVVSASEGIKKSVEDFIERSARRLGVTVPEFPKSKIVDKRDPYTHEPERTPTSSTMNKQNIKYTSEPGVNKHIAGATDSKVNSQDKGHWNFGQVVSVLTHISDINCGRSHNGSGGY